MLVFHDADGRIIGTLNEGYPAPPGVAERVTPAGASCIDVPPFDPLRWHVVDGEPRVRPILTIERIEGTDPDGTPVLTLRGLPAGLMIRVVGAGPESAIESDGEDVELVWPHPGNYRVMISGLPYQPTSFDHQVGTADGTA